MYINTGLDKNNKRWYQLTIKDINTSNKIVCFIPEALANFYKENGVKVYEKTIVEVKQFMIYYEVCNLYEEHYNKYVLIGRLKASNFVYFGILHNLQDF